MNVLFLSLDLFSYGGIQRYSRYLLQALRRSPGVASIRIASLEAPDGAGFEQRLAVDAVGRGPVLLRKPLFALDAVRLALSGHTALVICDHINLAPLAYVCGRLARRPYWLNVYAIEVWGDLSFLRRRALLGADVIVSDCDFTRRYLEERYPVLAGRITVVPDCVDVECFVPGSEGTAARTPTLLTVSRLAPGRSKGHERVMRALVELRSRGIEARYIIAGDGADRARLEAIAEAAGLRSSIEFRGVVSDAELPALYRECDVFALVSGFKMDGRPQGEGVPLVVLEAQSSGKPVVTSSRDGSAESIADGDTGILVDPADDRAITSALARLLSDAELRSRMGAAARRRAERQFSVEVFERRIGDVVARLSVSGPPVAVVAEAQR